MPLYARRLSRRGFLRSAAAMAAPLLVPASALGRDGSAAPSARIAMGSIGPGGRGRSDTQAFLSSPDSHVVAVCDVDTRRREAARQMVESYYARHLGRGSYRGCFAPRDFREILARDDIDAVMIATPDHWHAPMAIMAAKAGKDMYCEKPISVSIAEGRAVADAVARLGIIYQSGTQRRSVSHFRFCCELVRNGRIGTLKKVTEMLGSGPTCPPQPPAPVPEGFDYDMWLGPAPWAYYTPKRCHGSFRWHLDYSGGKITDQGAHFLDIAQWAMDTEHTGPVEIQGTGTFPTDGLWNTPVTYHVVCAYAKGVELHVTHPLYRGDWAIRFEGTEGWLLVTRHKLYASKPSLMEPLRSHETPLRRSDHHHQNFLEAVRTRTAPIAPPEIAHRSTTVCHLANLCLRLRRPLKWDPAAERFVGDDAANRMLVRAHREPWTV